jgi:hypothetical protein
MTDAVTALPVRSVFVFTMTLAIGLATAVAAGAQPSWTVTVTPTLNPLPIGLCAAIQVRVLDATGRDAPRNAAGARVTIADFDITVAGTGVVANRIDASHWESCACQGAPVGATATVTASYPAQSLAESARVPGVTMQETATFAVAAPKGTINPRACTGPRTAAAASTSGAPTMPSPVALSNVPTPGARVPAAPATATPPPVGPGPTSVFVYGDPAETKVQWRAPPYTTPGPTGYVVERWKIADPECCRVTSPTLTTFEWRDPALSSGRWRYKVTTIYADGRRGSATSDYSYPEPVVPSGFKAEQVGRGSVLLTWKPVVGAAYYVVAGPPTNQAMRVDGTTLTRTGVPVGDTSWQVSAMYVAPAPSSAQQGSAFAKTTVKVVNPRYRLIAESIRAASETVDAPLSTDGKYDEIYVASIAETYDRTSGILIAREPTRVSHVHGDVNGLSPGQRVKAGSGSATGGIRANDIVGAVFAAPGPTTPGGSPPFVLWDGDLMPGKVDLILHPTLWELDEPDYAMAREPREGLACVARLCNWVYYLGSPGGRSPLLPAVKAAVAGPAIAVVDGVDVWMPNPEIWYLERHDRDRPIGLVVGTKTPEANRGITAVWRDKVVILSAEKIEAALASGTNRIEVRFWDHSELPNAAPSAVNYLNGDYTLVIRIQRVP